MPPRHPHPAARTAQPLVVVGVGDGTRSTRGPSCPDGYPTLRGMPARPHLRQSWSAALSGNADLVSVAAEREDVVSDTQQARWGLLSSTSPRQAGPLPRSAAQVLPGQERVAGDSAMARRADRDRHGLRMKPARGTVLASGWLSRGSAGGPGGAGPALPACWAYSRGTGLSRSANSF